MHRFTDTLQRGQERSLIQVLARMNVRDTYPRTEGGADRLFCDEGFGAGDLNLRDIEVGTCSIDFLLCGGEFLAEILPSIEDRFGERDLGLLGPEFGLLDRDVECDQQGAGFDDLARDEPNLADRPCELVLQRNRAQGEDRSNRGRRLAMVDRSCHSHCDRLHGLRLISRGGLLVLDGFVFPRGQADAYEQHKRNK